MGKRIIQQRRGRGSGTYRSPSFRFKGEVKHYSLETSGTVTDLVHCAGHSSPLMEVLFLTGDKGLAFAPEGIKVGDEVSVGNESNNNGSELKSGSVLKLRDIPEGTLIHNIELRPADGGKLVRSAGVFAKIVAKTETAVRVKLPSKKEKLFLPDCRAAIGILSGAGKTEKPFLKAGTRFKKMKVRNKLYPKVCGISMNAVDHPFGGKCSHIKGRPTQSPRNAPPGRKVGKIAPRRTGRKG
ncbi:MAG: 50S ribosomal protein L2 [Nanoarchaeota archaeon]|nr:50S ribosomal protein L2 [Nanoarchaeota archaeon]MBU1644489.1 50S ribosomal protein L2 [Nanoarchaeota archaeon]MBU1976493.1 50S ribosomal protein L2 [Nanoarchaeota archaeon]